MRRSPRVATLVSILVAAAVLVLPGSALATASSPTSPVNLATPVDFGAAKAAAGATVLAGDARFPGSRRRSDPDGVLADPELRGRTDRERAQPAIRSAALSGQPIPRLADDHYLRSHAALPPRIGPVRPGQHVRAAGQRRHGHPAMGERVPVRPGVRRRRRGAERRGEHPDQPRELSEHRRVYRRPQPGQRRRHLDRARRARRPGRSHRPLCELHRRPGRPGAAHDRLDRQRLGRQDPDAAAHEQLGRLEHRQRDGTADRRH